MRSLATEYRPKTWEEAVEQKSTFTILQKQIETETFKHTYLFSGATGCGKTTAARIFAHEVNKHIGSPIEIDAASNNGVDNIRSIIKTAQERSIDSKYKVIIIDEAHMLTTQAWNAFLKCIEEPPEYTIFIFCTTDPQKIPATILNRVQRFNFTRISSKGIESRLRYICEQEHFTNFEDSIKYIARISNGGMRDAISLLEKCASLSTNISIQTVLEALGNYSYDMFFKLVNDIIDGKEAQVLEVISDYYNQGNDLKLFVDQFLTFCLDLNKYCLFKSFNHISIPEIMKDDIDKATNIENASKYYNYLLDKLLELKETIKNNTAIKAVIEISFLNMTRCM